MHLNEGIKVKSHDSFYCALQIVKKQERMKREGGDAKWALRGSYKLLIILQLFTHLRNANLSSKESQLSSKQQMISFFAGKIFLNDGREKGERRFASFPY